MQRYASEQFRCCASGGKEKAAFDIPKAREAAEDFIECFALRNGVDQAHGAGFIVLRKAHIAVYFGEAGDIQLDKRGFNCKIDFGGACGCRNAPQNTGRLNVEKAQRQIFKPGPRRTPRYVAAKRRHLPVERVAFL